MTSDYDISDLLREDKPYSRLTSRTWVEISRSNLQHNLQQIKARLPENVRLMVVVKGDAYGHGSQFIASEASWVGADFFAVALITEAESLRQIAIRQPILILSYTPYNEIASLLRNNISQTVSSFQEAKAYNDEVERVKSEKKLKIHVKLDTGMARLGISVREDDFEAAISEIIKISKLPGLELEGIFTHFAAADTDEEYTKLQFKRFTKAIERLKENNVTFKYHHCANSIASLRYPETCLDMVREGIIIYGCSDGVLSEDEISLKPVMSYYSRISYIRDLKAGETVGYGRTYRSDKDRRIAVIEAGYSDGLMRSLSNRGYVKLHGKKAPIIGRVCMDRSMIDISDIPEAKVNEKVCIFGGKGENFISADEQAVNARTISYELFCDVNRRVPRIYID